jgi:hypothetical protein
MKHVESLLVVGGGTAGLVSALILRQKLNSNIKIDLVASSKVGIIGVGEGTTEHWKDFCTYIGLDQYSFLKECGATYKCGILFQGWTEKDYLHSVATSFNSKAAQYNTVYGRQIGYNDPFIHPRSFWEGKIDKWFLNRPEEWTVNQFHFDNIKLNDFLTRVAKSRGINIIEDDIEDIILDDQGYIKSLKGNQTQYTYDFYIDSTGWKRILMTKLGGKWQSAGKYLKTKAAIAFQTEDEAEYNFWSLSKAMDYGWLFKIPVWGRHGNGYVFDSDYINADQAKDEVEMLLGKEINVGKVFNFDPGCIDRAWIKNCCVMGLAGSFYEPLEASSIGTSIQQSFLLMHNLPCYDDKTIDRYNKSFQDLTSNILDFISLHYLVKKDNSKFWKDIQSIPLTDSLKSNLEVWQNRLPINEDFSDKTGYILFSTDHFTVILEGLGLYNRQSIRKEYEGQSNSIKQRTEMLVENLRNIDSRPVYMSHKKFIQIIRDLP